jgi:hypothetical protein
LHIDPYGWPNLQITPSDIKINLEIIVVDLIYKIAPLRQISLNFLINFVKCHVNANIMFDTCRHHIGADVASILLSFPFFFLFFIYL